MILGIEYTASGGASFQVRQGFEQFLGTVYTEYSLLLNRRNAFFFFFLTSFVLHLLYINLNQYCIKHWFRNMS